ncbi:sialin-like [Antedon mediterranea]|uniref:sialin-like n=1 Tax=Antedon mediterranea TaxID=105859 RepID=UPI003AF5A0D3
MVGVFGGSSIILLGILVTSLMMLLTPVAAEVGVWLLVITRIVDGMAQGIAYPAVFNLVTNWSKLNERSTFLSFSLSGIGFGPVLASYISASLCLTDFLGGWPSTFYLFGLLGLAWCLGWCIVGSTDVSSNRWISSIERDSILFSQSEEIKNKNVRN